MRAVLQRKEGAGSVASEEWPKSQGSAPTFEEAGREPDSDAWDRTDRPFRYPAWAQTIGRRAKHSQGAVEDSAHEKWLQEHEIHTEFLDAGIGCCWFASQGDQEPVCGETEEEALARLARQKGFKLWENGVPV